MDAADRKRLRHQRAVDAVGADLVALCVRLGAFPAPPPSLAELVEGFAASMSPLADALVDMGRAATSTNRVLTGGRLEVAGAVSFADVEAAAVRTAERSLTRLHTRLSVELTCVSRRQPQGRRYGASYEVLDERLGLDPQALTENVYEALLREMHQQVGFEQNRGIL